MGRGAETSTVLSSSGGTVASSPVAPAEMAETSSGKGGEPSVPRARSKDGPGPGSSAASSENKKAGTKAAGGMDSGSGGGDREALTECALDALLAALSEPRNCDHVLRVDGAAPIVRVLTWRALLLGSEKAVCFWCFCFFR